ncbi:hypothetical protein BGZ94_003351 [Podila epigama]|nr:hypothetical protein BGZ94_003351 [Podila epigama]
MYQLTIPGETGLLAVASASLLIVSVGVTVVLTWRILSASSKFLLYQDMATLLKFGPVYSTLTEEGTLFFLVTLLLRFLWGLVVAMLSSYGIAQVAVLLVIELGYMIVIGVKWPYADSSENKFNIFLGIARIAVTGCSIAYLDELRSSADVRQLFGYIQMAIHLTVFIVMFALSNWNTIMVIIFWRTRHSAAWQGPSTNYAFDDPSEADHDWVLSGRPQSTPPNRHDPALEALKTRRYTVQPYTSIPDLRRESMMTSSHDESFQPRQPRDLYRRSLHPIPGHRRSRLPSDDDRNMMLDARSEAIVPLSSSAGPMSARSTSPHPLSSNGSVTSSDGVAMPLQPLQPSAIRFQQPVRQSYAKVERMNHQQAVDPRTRRMSDIFRDGPYVYQGAASTSETLVPSQSSKEKQGIWSSMKASLGGYLNLGKNSAKRSVGDGAKPKAFEVIRPNRPPPVRAPTSDNASQAGDDNLRELNSIGISRFFQESGHAYEKNRSLFVANPEALASRAGSVRSSVSGVRPRLERGETGTSVYTLGQSRLKSGHQMSADLGSILAGVGSVSDLGISDSRRVSVVHPRNSVESNIAEALLSETPLRLQGGGILKVSKGPEKAVQYWHKESGQYVEASAMEPVVEQQRSLPGPSQSNPLTSPSMLLLPASRGGGSFFEAASSTRETNRQPSIRSRAGSRPDSPTESHHSQSVNVAVSAGRMHEILDRMFSDPDDSDSMTEDEEETQSTFSGKVSAAILALQQRKNQEESELDAQSMYRSEILEPVLEHVGADDGHNESEHEVTRAAQVGGGLRRASSASGQGLSGTLMRTSTGPTRSTSSSSLRQAGGGQLLVKQGTSSSLVSTQRPLAQTPLHAPSIMPFSGSTTSLLHHGALGTGTNSGSLTRRSSHQTNLSRQSSHQSLNSLTGRSLTDSTLGGVATSQHVGDSAKGVTRSSSSSPSPGSGVETFEQPLATMSD